MDVLNLSICELIVSIFSAFKNLYIFGFATVENYLIVISGGFIFLLCVFIYASIYRIVMGKTDFSEEIAHIFSFESLGVCLLAALLWPVAILAFLGMGWAIFFPSTASLGE